MNIAQVSVSTLYQEMLKAIETGKMSMNATDFSTLWEVLLEKSNVFGDINLAKFLFLDSRVEYLDSANALRKRALLSIASGFVKLDNISCEQAIELLFRDGGNRLPSTISEIITILCTSKNPSRLAAVEALLLLEKESVSPDALKRVQALTEHKTQYIAHSATLVCNGWHEKGRYD